MIIHLPQSGSKTLFITHLHFYLKNKCRKTTTTPSKPRPKRGFSRIKRGIFLL